MTKEDVQALLTLERAARQRADGHFSVMRFTTNWKAALGTVTICNGGNIAWPMTYGRRCPEVHDHLIPSFPTLHEAVAWALEAGPSSSWQDPEATDDEGPGP